MQLIVWKGRPCILSSSLHSARTPTNSLFLWQCRSINKIMYRCLPPAPQNSLLPASLFIPLGTRLHAPQIQHRADIGHVYDFHLLTLSFSGMCCMFWLRLYVVSSTGRSEGCVPSVARCTCKTRRDADGKAEQEAGAVPSRQGRYRFHYCTWRLSETFILSESQFNLHPLLVWHIQTVNATTGMTNITCQHIPCLLDWFDCLDDTWVWTKLSAR